MKMVDLRNPVFHESEVTKALFMALLAVAFMAILASFTFVSAAHACYGFCKEITIDHTQVRILTDLRSTDLIDFPVYITIENDEDLRTLEYGGHVTSPHGYDIFFIDSDGLTLLDHEVEAYDGTAGSLIAWVRCPILYRDVDTVIKICYGNPNVTTSQENIPEVWISDYVMVQHLHETAKRDGDHNDHFDSTSYENNGEALGGVVMDSIGRIGGADDLDSSSGYIEVPHDDSLAFDGDFTIEGWFRRGDTVEWGQWSHPISKDGCYWIRIDSDTPVFHVDGLGDLFATEIMDQGGWAHVACVFIRGTSTHTMQIFVNGELNDEYIGWGTPGMASTPLLLGSYQGMSDYFLGTMDEVRISQTARTEQWIRVGYINQNCPSAFFALGSEEKILGAELRHFEGRPLGRKIHLVWASIVERAIEGFHIWRAESPEGPYTRITSSVIPSMGGLSWGSRYAYVDEDVSVGSTYFYKLEDIDIYGYSVFHGPVEVVLVASCGTTVSASGGHGVLWGLVLVVSGIFIHGLRRLIRNAR